MAAVDDVEPIAFRQFRSGVVAIDGDFRECGANIKDERTLDSVMERDVVTNYHIRQVLRLRRELLEALKKTE